MTFEPATGSIAMKVEALRPMRRLLLLICAGVAVNACSATPISTVTPAPVPQVAVTPGLEPRVRAWLTEYSNTSGVPGFDLVALPIQVALPRVQRGEAALVISIALPPAKWFVTPLGREGILFVTPASNPVKSLSLRSAADILAGRTVRWDSLGGPSLTIQPIIPLPGDDLRAWIEAHLLRGSTAASYSRLADSPDRSAIWIRADPGAIGYVPSAADLTGLQALSIEGVAATQASVEDGRYPLVADILAYAPSEPTGAVRDFLAWVQASKLKH